MKIIKYLLISMAVFVIFCVGYSVPESQLCEVIEIKGNKALIDCPCGGKQELLLNTIKLNRAKRFGEIQVVKPSDCGSER